MADDEDKAPDLLSRRMESGREKPVVNARETDEDTLALDPLDIPRADEPTIELAESSRPEMLSEEEWAILQGGEPVMGEDTPARGEASRDVAVPGGERRWSPLAIVGTIWMTLTVPFVLAAIAVRTIASPLFLRFEYFWRPGFPDDGYGWSASDREHYGSYVIDFLHNFDDGRYLGDVVQPDGTPVFLSEEIIHMEDVKALISLLYLVAIGAAIISIVFALLLSRRGGVGVRPGLFAGSILTLVAAIGLGVMGFLGFDAFFTRFHELLFTDGTWQFFVDDSLIRLFPQQFWVDAGIGVAVIVLVLAIVLLIVNRPRRRVG